MGASEMNIMFFFSFIFILINEAVVVRVNGAAKVVPIGDTTKVEDAQFFHIYYGQSFKVIKNSVDGKSYLLMQNISRMAARTKYCTGRIKSFVIPISNYSIDTTFFPVSFFELLGLLENLKGITSESLTSECVLKLYADGDIKLVNKTDIQQLTQFSTHFVSNVDDEQSCNFAAFVPLEETTPIERAEWIKYLSTFTNSEARANTVYGAIKNNYICLTKAAANLTARFKPVVVWVQYYQGIWSFGKQSFKLQYVTDAGGENLDDSISKNSYKVSDPDDMDSLHAVLSTVDVVIDETYVWEPEKYTLSAFLDNIGVDDPSCFGFLTNQRLWRYDKRIQKYASLVTQQASTSEEEACKNVDQENYSYCIKMLSGSGKESQKSLAIYANKLTVKHFDETKGKIEQLKKKEGMNKDQQSCISICENSYKVALYKLKQVSDNFKKGGFRAATNYLSAAMDKTTSCMDSFHKVGVEPMLIDENDASMNMVRVTSKLMETTKFDESS